VTDRQLDPSDAESNDLPAGSARDGIEDLLEAPAELIEAVVRTGREGVNLRRELLVLVRAVRTFINNEDWMNAAAVSFYAILSFIPFLLLMLSVLGFMSEAQTGQVALLDQLLEQFSDVAFLTPDLIAELRHLVAARGSIGVTGLVVLLIMGGAVFRGLEVSVGRIWRGGEIRKGGVKTVVLSRVLFGAAAMAVCLFWALADWLLGAMTPMLNEVAPEQLNGAWAWLGESVNTGWFLARFLVAMLFVGLLKYLTRWRVSWVAALRGGVMFSLLWAAAASLFRVYLEQSELSAVYGSFAALIVAVLWTFYSTFILLLSTEYAYVWHRIRRGDPVPGID
jgi:membrane protein